MAASRVGTAPRPELTNVVADLLQVTMAHLTGCAPHIAVDLKWVRFYGLRPDAAELYAVACGMATLVAKATPIPAGAVVGVEARSAATGEVLGNPDARVEQPMDRGALAAARFLAAWLNGDRDMAQAIASSVFDGPPGLDRGIAAHRLMSGLMTAAAVAVHKLTAQEADS